MSDTASPIRKLADNVYLFWALLALPAVYMLAHRLVLHGKVAFVPLSGEFAAYMLIMTMMVTPLMLLIGPLPWLKVRRRHLGVASFLYTVLHLAFWLVNANIGSFLRSFVRPDILAGWVAMAVMFALALTSSDSAVRKLGPRWKALQRWVYAVGALTLIHWLMTTHNPKEALIWSGPLILLSAWRIVRYQRRIRGV